MKTTDTPRTDKAEYEVRLGRHRRMVVRPALARELERELAAERALADRLAHWLETLISGHGGAIDEAHSANQALAAWRQARNPQSPNP